MEVADLSDILNVRAIKMETCENAFDDPTEGVEMSDTLSILPQYVSESDLGLMQSSSEMLQAPLNVFSDPADDDDTVQSNDSGSDEVIVQLMDIRTRLSKLRSILERRLGVNLSDYTFWLQDAKMLESHKTLVEQCVRGAGVVQVNIQIRPSTRKINILDVLKPDEEIAAAKEECHSPMPVEEVVEVLPTLVPSPSPQRPHAACVKWVVDASFRADRRAKIPDDPIDWSVQHTRLWIQWAVRQFNVRGIKISDWSLSGAQLTALTNQQFREKVPFDPGDLLWTHFELLRKCKFIAVIQTDEPNVSSPMKTTSIKDNLTINSVIDDPTLNAPQSAIKKKPKLVFDDGIASSNTNIGRSSNGQTQLWQFLLELLTSARHYHVIRWHGTEGEFKLLEPEKVARLWGLRKHKPAMNYEKLSRALRYYYDGDMIAKVTGKRFVYKFVCDLRQLIGYSPLELAEFVKEVYFSGQIDDDDSNDENMIMKGVRSGICASNTN